MRMMKHLSVLLLALLVSCSQESSSLLTEEDRSERLDERARRMALTLVDANGETGESSAEGFAIALGEVCAAELPPG